LQVESKGKGVAIIFGSFLSFWKLQGKSISNHKRKTRREKIGVRLINLSCFRLKCTFALLKKTFMDFTFFIMTAVLVVTLIAPVFSYYAIKKAKQKDFATHKKIQTLVYAFCIAAVLVLELLIRFSGGSGSMFEDSSYAVSPVFKTILIAHIIGAVLTYIVWTFLIINSHRKFTKTLPGKFSNTHKVLGISVFIGLIYTGVSAFAVFLMTFDFI